MRALATPAQTHPILHPDDYELWLDSDVRKLDLIKEVLRPFPAIEMIGYPIGTSINSPSNQDAVLIERVEVYPT